MRVGGLSVQFGRGRVHGFLSRHDPLPPGARLPCPLDGPPTLPSVCEGETPRSTMSSTLPSTPRVGLRDHVDQTESRTSGHTIPLTLWTSLSRFSSLF